MMSRLLQHRKACRTLLAGILLICGPVQAQDNKPVIVITPEEVCDYCGTLVGATFDLTGEQLYVVASGTNQDGNNYSYLSLWNITRTSQARALPVVKTRSPVTDSADFTIQLDSTGRLLGIAGTSLKLWYAEVSNSTLPYLATIGSDFTSIHSFGFSPKSDKVAAGYQANNAHFLGVWDTFQLNDGEPKQFVNVNTRSAWSIKFSASGQYILDSAEDVRAELWDLSQIHNGIPEHIPLKEIDSPFTTTFDKTAKQVGVSMGWGAGLWDMGSILSGDTAPKALMQHQGDVYFIAFDATGRYIVTTSHDQTAKLWDSSQIIDSAPLLLATMNHNCAVKEAFFAHNNTRMYTRCDYDIKHWDIQHIKDDGKATLLNTFHMDNRYYPSQKIETDPAGIWLLTVNSEMAELWDVAALLPDQETTTETTTELFTGSQ